jgi:hypothetical protein
MTDANRPMTADDARVLTLLAEAQDLHDPMPPGLIERISLAVSLELMEAELAVLIAHELEPARADTPVDSITFTASSLSLMVTMASVDDGVRVDGWVTGGGVEVELLSGDESFAATSDATGRLTWPTVAHGAVRFRIRAPQPGSRVVVTPTIEV